MTRIVLLIAFSGLLLAGCLGPGVDDVDILATHYPLAFTADRLAGDNLTTGAMVEGHLPHDWEPSVRDVERLDAAALYLAQGAGFEEWLDDTPQNLDDPPIIVETTRDLHLIHHDGGGHDGDSEGHDEDSGGQDGDEHGRVDPHTWMDPTLLAAQARIAADAMADRWPDHAEAIQDRAEVLEGDLAALDESYRNRVGEADCETRTIVVDHNAYAYLGARYNVTVEPVHGLSPETEPSAETMDRLAQLVEERNITVVFFEEFASPEVVEALADETGADAEVLHPLGGRTDGQRADDRNYVDLMEENLDHLEGAMRCQPAR
jgi:zinc transport system substrate-binding protein